MTAYASALSMRRRSTESATLRCLRARSHRDAEALEPVSLRQQLKRVALLQPLVARGQDERLDLALGEGGGGRLRIGADRRDGVFGERTAARRDNILDRMRRLRDLRAFFVLSTPPAQWCCTAFVTSIMSASIGATSMSIQLSSSHTLFVAAFAYSSAWSASM